MVLTQVIAPEFVYWLASLVGMSAAWWELFKRSNKALSEEDRESVRDWALQGSRFQAETTWPRTFLKLFDAFFMHRRWTSLIRPQQSILATTIFLFSIFTILSFGAGQSPALTLAEFFEDREFDAALYIVGVGFLGNLLGDYVSLYETRSMIFLSQRVPNVLVQALLIFADFILSGMIIGVVVFAIAMFNPPSAQTIDFGYTFLEPSMGLWPNLWAAMQISLTLPFVFAWQFLGEGKIEDISAVIVLVSFLLTSYFTSIWLWFYLLAGALGRVLSLLYHTVFGGTRRLYETKALGDLSYLQLTFIIFTVIIHLMIFPSPV
ncbi:MAG: hypothetical protein ACFB6R_13065 [Alphaproteobacteria bacterium]